MKTILALLLGWALCSQTLFAATVAQASVEDTKGNVYWITTNGRTTRLYTVLLISDAGVMPQKFKTLLLVNNATGASILSYFSSNKIKLKIP